MRRKRRMKGINFFLLGFLMSFLLFAWPVQPTQAVDFAWDPDSTGPAWEGFNFYYWEAGLQASTEQKIPITDPNQTELTIPNSTFEYNKTYEFRVHAYNSIGESGPSNIVSWERPVDASPGPCILRFLQ